MDEKHSPDVSQILTRWLTDNKYDGLFNADLECGCEVGDMAPCGEPGLGCLAGYKLQCDTVEFDYIIGPRPEGDDGTPSPT